MRLVSYTRSTSCLIGDDVPSNIIALQNERIRLFADDLGLRISKTYSDRKVDKEEDSAFQQMFTDAMNRKLDGIIVDSLLRCGKDIWNARQVLLDTLFPAGIHFYVAEDRFSSNGKTLEEATAYFEEIYSRYRQENIRRRVNSRNRNGILSWNDCKYGYHLTENNTLEPDEETAPIVKRIFAMAADGVSPAVIAETLTAEKIFNPLYMRKTKTQPKDPYYWSRLSITRILKCETYSGHWTKIVQGEEMHFTNEALVTQEVFQNAQQKPQRVGAKKPRPKYKYTNLITDENGGFVYRCRKSRFGFEYLGCVEASLTRTLDVKQLMMADLDQAVLDGIKKEQELATVLSRKIVAEGENILEQRLEAVSYRVKELSFVCAELQLEQMRLWKSNSIEGKITDKEYEQALEELEVSRKKNEKEIGQNMELYENLKIAFSEQNPWLVRFLNSYENKEVTRDLLQSTIEVIRIERLERIEIIFLDHVWKELLPEDWRSDNGKKK